MRLMLQANLFTLNATEASTLPRFVDRLPMAEPDLLITMYTRVLEGVRELNRDVVEETGNFIGRGSVTGTWGEQQRAEEASA